MHIYGARLLRWLLKPKVSGVVSAFFLVIGVFSLLSKEFLTIDTFLSILFTATEIGTISVGVSFLMISGEFDLSVGAIFATSAMFLALLIKANLNAIGSFLIVLGIAMLMGFTNGMIVRKTRIPSFIVTLGMMMFWRGVLLAITGGFAVMLLQPPPLLDILGGKIGKFHLPVLWVIVVTLVFAILLNWTKYGNWVFATGEHEETAKAFGVDVNKVKLINFTLTGLLAGFAGILNLARFRAVDPTLGSGLELEAIAAAVIGGNVLTGGYGTIIGALMGACLIETIKTGLVLAGAPSYWYRAFVGVIIIIATVVNEKIRRTTR